jgi:peptide/nickel transport system permease protein
MSEATIAAVDRLRDTPTRRRRPPLVIGLCFLLVALVIVMAIFGAAIAPYDPAAQDLSSPIAQPSAEHWLGTDSLGRDVTSRVISGARTALVGPLVIALGSMLIGNLLGLLAGYRGGRVDATIMRWVDLMWAIPSLLVIIVVSGAIGGGYWVAVALLVLLTVPFDTRVVRGATLEQVPRPYVEAAKTLGVSDRRIMLRHIWPNVSAAAIANTFLVFAGSLVALSSLSFLGLGAEPGIADWGQMLSEEQSLLFLNPVVPLAPGVAIVLLAASMNLIGDWLYEQLSSRGGTR